MDCSQADKWYRDEYGCRWRKVANENGKYGIRTVGRSTAPFLKFKVHLSKYTPFHSRISVYGGASLNYLKVLCGLHPSRFLNVQGTNAVFLDILYNRSCSVIEVYSRTSFQLTLKNHGDQVAGSLRDFSQGAGRR